jgi:hypothetical protein
MSCCCLIPSPPPFVEFISEGYQIADWVFKPETDALIPEDYFSVKWLGVQQSQAGTLDWEWRVCDEPSTDWFEKETRITDEIYNYSYVDDFTEACEASGTGSYQYQLRPEICDDPPVADLQINDQATYDFSTACYTDGGTATVVTSSDINGDPLGDPVYGAGIVYSEFGDVDVELVLGDDSVIERKTSDWDGFFDGLYHYAGGQVYEFGYHTLAPITARITPEPTVIFQQVFYQLVFKYWDDTEPTVIEEGEWIYLSGDDPKEVTFTPLRPGSQAKLTIHHRCSRNMPFQKKISEQ